MNAHFLDCSQAHPLGECVTHPGAAHSGASSCRFQIEWLVHDRVAVLEPRGYAWVLSGLPYAAGLVRSVAAARNPCPFERVAALALKGGMG